MFRILFLVLLLVPAVELYVMIQVGGVIGGLPTILLTVATALLGTALMRSQGLMTLQTLQVQLAQGVRPESTLVEGALILTGGILLLIPGFITDALGIALLVPGVRRRLTRRFMTRSAMRADFSASVVVEGEVVREDERQSPPDGLPPMDRRS